MARTSLGLIKDAREAIEDIYQNVNRVGPFLAVYIALANLILRYAKWSSHVTFQRTSWMR